MPRIRTIKPELWQSPEVMNLSHGARLLFIGLITQADDFGRGSADLRQVKATIFPGYDSQPPTLQGWLAELGAQRLAILYSHPAFGDLFALPTWDEHQYVQKRAKRSKYPRPDGTTGTLPEDSDSATVGSDLIKDQGKERKGSGASAPDDSPGQAPEAEPAPPPGLDPAAWKRWRDYRREIRKPLKPVSLPAAQRELAAFGCDQSAVVEQSIANGWQGLFALKPKGIGGKPPPPPKRPPPTEAEISEERRKAMEANRRELAAKVGVIAAMPR